jgi:UDP-N-acetylmuramate dehydrogenase
MAVLISCAITNMPLDKNAQEGTMDYLSDVRISQLTTMGLGGLARLVVQINDIKDCQQAYEYAEHTGLPTYILGSGSNVIGRDEGFSGLLLLNRLAGIEVLAEESSEVLVKIGSGELLDTLVGFAATHGWSGIEALSAVPGTVGGAVVQNAGAYGQELSDALVSVEVFDRRTRDITNMPQSLLGLSYRQSIFNAAARGYYFILSAVVRLRVGQIQGDLYRSLQSFLDQRQIYDRSPLTIRNAITDLRSENVPNPQVEASAGSFFKNVTLSADQAADLRKKHPGVPIISVGHDLRVSSGWLIEQCGFKGRLLHGIRVSNQSALILINESAQSYQDLAEARQEIIQAVQAQFGLLLQQEPEEIY